MSPAVGPPAIVQAAHAGDPEARELLASAGRYLGQAIGNIANLLNPSLFIIGGGVAAASGKLLLEVGRRGCRAAGVSSPALLSESCPRGPERIRAGVLGAAAYAHRQLAVSR